MDVSRKSFCKHLENRLYSLVSSVRPAVLASFFKAVFGIHRKYLKTDQGYIFWVDPISHFGWQILQYGIYEPQMTQLLRLALRAGDVFIDVGAHEGYFSILASSLVADGQVHCIEPQRRLQQVIRENARINHSVAIKIHRIALTDKESEVELFLAPSTISGSSSMCAHYKLLFHKEKVAAITLDTFFEINKLKWVRLLKIDAEGAEYGIVTGGINVVRRRCIDFIALEYHPTILTPERIMHIHEILKGAGYILTQCRGQTIYHLPGLEKEIQALGDLKVDAPL